MVVYLKLIFKLNRSLQLENEHCLLLALPCGRDPLDVHAQTKALKNGFIAYLQQKLAAGIINIAEPGSQQVTMTVFKTVYRA